MSMENVKNIGVQELKSFQKNGALIIDVRNEDEIAETGVLPGGINIPLSELEVALKKAPNDFKKNYGREKPEKNTEIIFSCKSGRRSLMASQKAIDLGFNNVINFEGGWLAWENQA